MSAFRIIRRLRDLLDFTLGAPSDGDVVTYDSGTGEFVLAPPAATGAPTTADYLVGTANGGLSGEIVAGTSPGGELGGTWAAPTVDATHSGSSHASVQAAAEATAAGALGVHESDTTAVHGIADTSLLALAAAHPILAPATDARNVIQPTAATIVPLTVKGFTAQSDDLFQAQDDSANVLAAFTAAGKLHVGRSTTNDTTLFRLEKSGTGQAGISFQIGGVEWGAIRCNAAEELEIQAGSAANPTSFRFFCGTVLAMRVVVAAGFVDNVQSSFFQLAPGYGFFTGSAGAVLPRFGVTATGSVFTDGSYTGMPAPIGLVDLVLTTTTRVGLIVKAAASQTGDLVQAQNSSAAVQSRFNKAGYFMTRKVAAPADADMTNSEVAIWLTDTPGATIVNFKAKDSGGTVRTATLAMA